MVMIILSITRNRFQFWNCVIYFRPASRCVAVFCIGFDNIDFFFSDYSVCSFVSFSSNGVFLACGVYGVKKSFSVLTFAMAMRSERPRKLGRDGVWFCFPVTCQSNCGRGLTRSNWLILFNIICFHLSNIFDVQFLQWVKPFKCNYNSTLVIGGLLF